MATIPGANPADSGDTAGPPGLVAEVAGRDAVRSADSPAVSISLIRNKPGMGGPPERESAPLMGRNSNANGGPAVPAFPELIPCDDPGVGLRWSQISDSEIEQEPPGSGRVCRMRCSRLNRGASQQVEVGGVISVTVTHVKAC